MRAAESFIPLTDQLLAAAVGQVNQNRIQAEAILQSAQDQAFLKSVEQIDAVREFIGKPENILGSARTKHGEIAEQVEVGVNNAKSILRGLMPDHTFEGVGRTASEDYRVAGIHVQSKFINGINNNLDHVLKHMEKYDHFGRDGSYYHIPKDSHEVIMKVMNDEPVEGLSRKTAEAIKRKVIEIEQKSGQSIEQVVRPGISNYDEIQTGKVSETLDRHEQDLSDQNDQLKSEIHDDHKASLADGAKAAGIAAAVGAAVSMTTTVWKKHKEGKNLFRGQYNVDDWKELGVEGGKGALAGGVTGAAIYGLTNYASLSAPFAGAVVSGAKAVSELVQQYNHGEISLEEFCDLGMMACTESAIVGLCTAAGQALIPVPALGAVLGSIAGQMLTQFSRGKVEGVGQRMRREMDEFISRLDAIQAQLVMEIDRTFRELGDLTTAAFDLNRNELLLDSSVKLARAYQVDESEIIKTHDELDDFMMA